MSDLPKTVPDLSHYAGVGLSAITFERAHQFDLGYTVNHDHECHSPEQLMRVAACYLDFAAGIMEDVSQDEPHPFWPDCGIPWKPEGSAELYAVKAAAFTVAALDLARAREVEGLTDERAK